MKSVTVLSRIVVPALAISSVLAFSLSGCGEEEEGGGGGAQVNSGLAPETPLNTLMPADYARLTESYAAAISSDQFVDAICKTIGYSLALFGSGDFAVGPAGGTAGGGPVGSASPAPTASAGPGGENFQQACNEAVNACKMSFSGQASLDEGSGVYSLPADSTPLAECTVTVGQLEACLNETLAATIQAASAISCDTPPDTAQPATSAPAPTGAPGTSACEAVLMQCPAALGQGVTGPIGSTPNPAGTGGAPGGGGNGGI